MGKPDPARPSADQLVADHLWLVNVIATGVLERLPPQVIELQDLIAEGTFGLMEAADKFDPDNGVLFRTFARYRIRGAILDFLRRTDFASRDTRRQFKRIARAMQLLNEKLLRTPSEEEIAVQLGMDLDNYRRRSAKVRACGGAALSLTRLKEEKCTVRDPEGPRQEWPDRRCATAELRDSLVSGGRELTRRYRAVLAMYYRDELTMKEIGQKLGVNESRVCQIHKSALGKLRIALEAKGIRSAQAF